MVMSLASFQTLFFKPFGQLAGIKYAQSAIILIVFGMLSACAALAPASAPQTAQQALQAAITDYEGGSLKTLEAMLPARFVGSDSLLDAARRAATEQRQIRITLSEVQTQGTVGSSPQALSFKWEKRFLRASTGAAFIERGSLQTVLSKSGDAWQFENLPADNLFTR